MAVTCSEFIAHEALRDELFCLFVLFLISMNRPRIGEEHRAFGQEVPVVCVVFCE